MAALMEILGNRPDYLRIECDDKLVGDNVMVKTLGVSNL
jgi:hypothetical protein